MQRRLYNIGDNETTTLITAGGSKGSIASIRLTNSSNNSVDVDLFLREIKDVSTTRAHVLTTSIPSKTSVFLDEGVNFDNSVLGLDIITTNGTLSDANPLSIIIK